jgi:hypothetical protein
MLIQYDDKILSSELTEVVGTIIKVINTSVTEREVTISCIYNLFANIKSLITLDQAFDDKLGYGTLEYQFFDLTEDYDAFIFFSETSDIDQIQDKQVSELTLNDIENIVDFYVQLLKEERTIYQDFMLLTKSPFVNFYASIRSVVLEEYLSAMQRSREELAKFYELLSECQQSLYLIRNKHPHLYKTIDTMIIQIDWILRNEQLTLEQYSVGALLDYLEPLVQTDTQEE